jgi:hypothetical protein
VKELDRMAACNPFAQRLIAKQTPLLLVLETSTGWGVFSVQLETSACLRINSMKNYTDLLPTV